MHLQESGEMYLETILVLSQRNTQVRSIDIVNELGYSNQKINSGAGHDAQFASYMLPTTMVFVPSKDGHSHCEPEFTSTKQCTMGASVLLNAVLKCDKDANKLCDYHCQKLWSRWKNDRTGVVKRTWDSML